jgi:hypothetical protein
MMPLNELRDLVKQQLEECDQNTAPAWLNHHEALAWSGGKSAALQWMLDLMHNPDACR